MTSVPKSITKEIVTAAISGAIFIVILATRPVSTLDTAFPQEGSDRWEHVVRAESLLEVAGAMPEAPATEEITIAEATPEIAVPTNEPTPTADAIDAPVFVDAFGPVGVVDGDSWKFGDVLAVTGLDWSIEEDPHRLRETITVCLIGKALADDWADYSVVFSVAPPGVGGHPEEYEYPLWNSLPSSPGCYEMPEGWFIAIYVNRTGDSKHLPVTGAAAGGIRVGDDYIGISFLDE